VSRREGEEQVRKELVEPDHPELERVVREREHLPLKGQDHELAGHDEQDPGDLVEREIAVPEGRERRRPFVHGQVGWASA
jgi:hypothetical protein